MASKRDEIKKGVDAVVDDGWDLAVDEADYWTERSESETRPKKKFSFGNRYHRWYSRALPLVRQLAPERAEEFELYFRDPKQRQMTLSTYTIQDHISGLTPATGRKQPSWANQAMSRFSSQIAIVEAIQDGLDSLLGDIESVLQADLFDDEIDTARDLAKKHHLRAAGAVAGVVLERHLKTVAGGHDLGVRKNANLGRVNDALKDGGVYATPDWRRIQRFADIRNYCVHDKEREPTTEEVQDLIDGADRIVKNIF